MFFAEIKIKSGWRGEREREGEGGETDRQTERERERETELPKRERERERERQRQRETERNKQGKMIFRQIHQIKATPDKEPKGTICHNKNFIDRTPTPSSYSFPLPFPSLQFRQRTDAMNQPPCLVCHTALAKGAQHHRPVHWNSVAHSTP